MGEVITLERRPTVEDRMAPVIAALDPAVSLACRAGPADRYLIATVAARLFSEAFERAGATDGTGSYLVLRAAALTRAAASDDATTAAQLRTLAAEIEQRGDTPPEAA